MRSTAKQRFNVPLPPRNGARWLDGHLAFVLRLGLAASTVAASFVVLSQDPPRPEMRLLLAALAVSLFLSSLMERRGVHRTSQPPTISGGSGGDHDVQAKIKQLERHRTDYVATVSHELRTPLTSIRGFAQLLTREELPVSISQFYGSTIVAEADKLARVVDDILDLTRMENYLLGLRRDPVCTSDLLLDVVERLQPALADGRMKLNLPPYLPWVHGDRERLEQVLARIVLEAIGHSSSEAPISLTAEAGDDHVIIRLEYAAAPERVDRMARALEGLGQFGEDGLATRLGHRGLALYICKNLIEAQGGAMQLVRAGEQEAIITITLPC